MRKAQRRRIQSLALGLLAVPLMAEGVHPLGEVGPAAAPWWPPAQPNGIEASPMGGWSMAEGGPMFMPTHVRDMVFGNQGTFVNQGPLQGVLQRIWQHLAARVNDLEDMENRGKLIREETAALREHGVGGQNVLVRLEEKVRELWIYSRGRSEELRTKFSEVMLFKERLKARYPQAGRDLDTYFLALRQGEEKVKKRYTSLGYALSETRKNLEAMAESRADKIRDMVTQVRTGTLPAVQLRGAPDKGPMDNYLNVQQWEREYRQVRPPPPPPALPEGYYAPRGPALPPPDAGWENLPPPAGWHGLPGTPVYPVAPPVAQAPTVPYSPTVPPPPLPPPPSLGDRGEDELFSRSLLPRSNGGGPPSARELLQDRIARLRAMRQGGMTTEQLEQEIRQRKNRPPVELLPPDSATLPRMGMPGMVPVPAGPPVDPQADGLLEDFLEEDTVLDPYLSKLPGVPGAPTDDALQKKLEQVFSGQGGDQPILRPPPQVNPMGTFAKTLQQDLELASRTEGLDGTRRFTRSKPPTSSPAERPAPTQRSVQDILSELKALEE